MPPEAFALCNASILTCAITKFNSVVNITYLLTVLPQWRTFVHSSFCLDSVHSHTHSAGRVGIMPRSFESSPDLIRSLQQTITSHSSYSVLHRVKRPIPSASCDYISDSFFCQDGHLVACAHSVPEHITV